MDIPRITLPDFQESFLNAKTDREIIAACLAPLRQQAWFANAEPEFHKKAAEYLNERPSV